MQAPDPILGLMDRFTAALNTHDLDAVLALVTDDIVFEATSPPPDGTRYQGRAAVAQVWGDLLASTPGARFAVEEQFSDGSERYAASVKIRDFDGNVLMDGAEAMRGQYGPLFRDSPQLSVEIPRRMVAGDYVVDEENLSGFILAGFPPQMHAIVVYRVQEGLIHDVVLVM